MVKPAKGEAIVFNTEPFGFEGEAGAEAEEIKLERNQKEIVILTCLPAITSAFTSCSETKTHRGHCAGDDMKTKQETPNRHVTSKVLFQRSNRDLVNIVR